MAASRFAATVALIERHRAALAWVLALGFVLVSLPELAAQAPNFDEGVYVMQARMVRGGAAPYVDFFYHQTPLYLYALAGFSALGPDTLVTYRLLSLLATAVAGVVVAAAARRGVGTFATIAVQLVFYAAPLQSFGKLALPNATMVLLSTLGIFAVVFTTDRRFTWAGAVCLALAVGVKPLAAPTVIAVVGVVALHPRLRHRLPALVLGGLLTGGASWGGIL